MVKAVFIPADIDEEVEAREAEGFEALQAAVGGWVEAVDVPSLGVTIYINEEGRVRHLPFNSRALFLWWYYVPRDRPAMLVGNVIVVGAPNKRGDDTDVPEPVLRLLTQDQEVALLLKVGGDPLDLAHPATGIVLPLTHGDPSWVLSSALYDDFWSAMVWAKVLQERWPAVEETKVVSLEEVPEHLRHAFGDSPRNS